MYYLMIITRMQIKTIAKIKKRREGMEKENGRCSKYADFTIFLIEESVDIVYSG